MSVSVLLPGAAGHYPNYEAALTAAGARVCFGRQLCDGLLLPGGNDIDPRLYGQKPVCCRDADPERDAEELALFRLYREAGRPIFGICREMQLINTALGGDLLQDIPGHDQVNDADQLHSSSAAPGSFLHLLYGPRFTVNSAHHQAIGRLAEGLRAVQWAGTVVEAVCHTSAPLWGVQWHPERLSPGSGPDGAVDGQKVLRFFAEQCSR